MKRTRALSLAVALVAGATLLIAANDRPERVVEAERFVLVDGQGRQRGVLEVTAGGKGGAELSLTNAFGHRVVVLEDGTETTGLAGAEELAGPALSLWHPSGNEPIVMLRADKNGGSLNIGVEDKVSLSATASLSTGAIISVDDPEERTSSSIHAGSVSLEHVENSVSLAATDGPTIDLQSGNSGGITLSRKRDGFAIDLFNCAPTIRTLQSGKSVSLCTPTPQMVLSITPDGPSLEMDDRDGFSTRIGRAELVAPATGKRSVTSAASLILFDKKSNVLWSAP